MQHDNKRAISTVNLVGTKWLSRYPIPTEIMYDQGSKIIGHEIKKILLKHNMG